MAFRFRRRVRILPGVTLNLSSRGISTTIGVRGASVNLGPNGTTANLGIPGTGIAYRTRIAPSSGYLNAPSPAPAPRLQHSEGAHTGAPRPDQSTTNDFIPEVTSEGLDAFKATVLEATAERDDRAKAVVACREQLARESEELAAAEKSLSRVFKRARIDELRVEVADRTTELAELEEQYATCHVEADFDLREAAHLSWHEVVVAFEDLSSCERIWRATSTTGGDSLLTRNSSTVKSRRDAVQFSFGSANDLVRTSCRALRFGTSTAVEMILYPCFLLLRSPTELGLVDLRELEIKFAYLPYNEHDVPSDADIMATPWARTKRDGTRDRRFRANTNTIARYGELRLSSSTGLNEQFQFSNHEKASRFVGALLRHKSTLRGEVSPSASMTLKGVTVGCDEDVVLRLQRVDIASPAYIAPWHDSPTEDSRLVDLELFANHVVLAWENVREDGHPATYTPAKGLELLSAILKASANLFDSVTAFARDAHNFERS